jgi:hypothetical protein
MSNTCANPTGGIVGPRDISIFLSIGGELTKQAVQQLVNFYKVNPYESKTNLYGESLGKTYFRPVELYARVEYGEITTTYEGFGPDATQVVKFSFVKQELIDSGIYLEVGDYIGYNNGYYEVNNVNENQFIAGQPANSLSIVAGTFLTRKSSLNIEERIK